MLTTTHARGARGRAGANSASCERATVHAAIARRDASFFPASTAAREWGGAAFDPATALLYVNSNEMPWIVRLIPNNDTAVYNSKCATCHREDRTGIARGAVAR